LDRALSVGSAATGARHSLDPFAMGRHVSLPLPTLRDHIRQRCELLPDKHRRELAEGLRISEQSHI
jgi:hypothetical protein